MSMNKTIGLLIAFVFVMIMAMYAVSFTSTVQAPSNTSSPEGIQYNALSSTIGIANSGVSAVMLFLILAMVLCAIGVMVAVTKRH